MLTMGKLLNICDENNNDQSASVCVEQEFSTKSKRRLPHKRPSIIRMDIFQHLLNFTLTCLPEERTVFLTMTHWFVDIHKLIVMFCVRFVKMDIFQPLELYRLEGIDSDIVKEMHQYWRLYIEDLSILNLKVIGSISDPSHLVIQVLKRFNKELEITDAITYTVLPYKDIVHIFGSQELCECFEKISRVVPFIYFISEDSDDLEGIEYKGMKLMCVKSIDVITPLLPHKLQTEQDPKKAVQTALKIHKYYCEFSDSVNECPDIMSNRFVQIVKKNSDFIRFLATARFSNVDVKQSDIYQPSASLVDHYAKYQTVLSMPPLVKEKTGIPVNPYYLLSKDTCWPFMKPSGCVGKRSENLRREIARRAEQHLRGHQKASKSEMAAGKLPNDGTDETADERKDATSPSKNERRNLKSKYPFPVEIKDESNSMKIYQNQCNRGGVRIEQTEGQSLNETQSSDVKYSLNQEALSSLERHLNETITDNVFRKLQVTVEYSAGVNPQDIAAQDEDIIKVTSNILCAWMDNVFTKKYQNIQAEKCLDNRSENKEAFLIVTEFVEIILENVEDFSESRRDAYNHIMSRLIEVTVSDRFSLFKFWIFTLKGYLKLSEQMLKYNIKSIKANALNLAMSYQYADTIGGGSLFSGKILVYPKFNPDAVRSFRSYLYEM